MDARAMDARAPFPWPDDAQYAVAQMIGWVNAELMKNVAGFSQLGLLRACQAGG